MAGGDPSPRLCPTFRDILMARKSDLKGRKIGGERRPSKSTIVVPAV